MLGELQGEEGVNLLWVLAPVTFPPLWEMEYSDAADRAWAKFAIGKGSSCDIVGGALCCVVFDFHC